MKKEGDRKVCVDCQIEVHVERIVFRGEERLSWRNPDGSAHFEYDEEKKTFLHTPTKSTPQDIRIEEIEERLARCERQLGIVRVE